MHLTCGAARSFARPARATPPRNKTRARKRRKRAASEKQVHDDDDADAAAAQTPVGGAARFGAPRIRLINRLARRAPQARISNSID